MPWSLAPQAPAGISEAQGDRGQGLQLRPRQLSRHAVLDTDAPRPTSPWAEERTQRPAASQEP